MQFLNAYPRIDFIFHKNHRDFVVEEIQGYEFTGSGEHRILKIRKKDITTFEMIDLISKALNMDKREIGYAGLKDKYALAYQFISIPKKYDISALNSIENVKIIHETLHVNKIKLGHLRGNKFFVRLKRVEEFEFKRLKSELLKAAELGFPNYFGSQRFGNVGDNYNQGERIKNKPSRHQNIMDKFFISSLQSHYFNQWLNTRMKISKIISSFSVKEIKELLMREFEVDMEPESIKLIKDSKLVLAPINGDVCKHYPFGRLFHLQDLRSEIPRMQKFDISITGLLDGNKKNTYRAQDKAKSIEDKFLCPMNAIGQRRYAVLRPVNVDIKYTKELNHANITFELPSGGYATTMLQYIKNDRI